MNQLYTQSPPLMPTEHTGIGGRTVRLLTRWLGMTAGIFILISTLWGSSAQAQNRPFITRWDLSKPGNGPTTLSFVCYTAPGETVSYTWQQVGGSASGSGTITNNLVNILGLPAGIILDVSIDPTHLQRIYVAGEYHFNRLTEIRQWGDVAWTSMQNAFSQCSNMTLTATDVPNLAGVTNISAMFRGCSSFNQALPEGFDPSNVTSMSFMFFGCTAYDKALPNSFNTSKVTNMTGMFSGCTAYDKALPSSFNTSNVTSMTLMFDGCSAYNQALPNSFNTSEVTDMSGMFRNCSKFNQSVSNFSTENVANMAFMFEGCAAFNQSLATFKLNDKVNLANFLNNSGLSVANYDATLKAFNAQSVTGRTMDATGLQYCEAEADRANLVKSTAEGGKGWTITDGGKAESCAVAATPTITVTGTLEPFLACSGEPSRQQKFKVSGSDLTGAITVFVASGVEVSTASSISNFGSSVTLTPVNGSVNATIFVRSPASTVPANGGSSTSGSISVTSSGAESKSVQFRASTEPFPSITLRSIANVSTTATSFRIPFTDLTSADQYSIVAGPLTSNTTPMPNFSAVTNEAFPEGSLRVPIPASAAGTYDFILTVSSTSTGCVSAEVPFTLTVEAPPAPVGRPFITRWDLSKPGSAVSGGTTSLVIGVATALGQNVSYTWQQVGGSASGSGTFTGSSLNIKDLPEGIILDLSIDPTHFQRFAIGIGSFNPQRLTEIRQWGDVAWTSMASAFVGCSNMLLTATDIPNLTGVTDMSNMFSYCSSFNQALPEGFNTSNVTNMFAMFNGCTIYDQPLPSSFNTANVTDMGHMFRQCSRYNQTLPNSFNTEKVTNMHRMFEECFAYDKALPSSFNTANVTDMSYMFRRCSAYNKALPSGFTTAAVTNMTVMFGSCTVFDQSVSNFNTEKVTSMFLMFSNCAAFNQSVSNFNTEKVTDMSGMFFGCQAFNQSLANFKLNPEVKLTEFLNRSGLSVANYDATLKAFNAQSVTGRTMGATGLQYCEAEADRTNLVKSTAEGGKGWTITDGGKVESCAVAATPTITVTGTLEPFLACSGEPSRQQKFKVSGSDLTGAITVFVASGVEVSTASSISNFGSSVTLTPVNGSVNATIFVRSPASTVPANGGSSTSGSISVTSSGAESKSVQFRASTEPFPSITLRSIANVSTTATSFRIPFTDLTSADQYSIVAGPLTSNTTPMPNFSAVTNEAFPEGSLRVPIPASAAGTYDFILTVSSTSTGCVSAEVPFTLTVEAPPAPVGRPFITRWDLSKPGSAVSGGTTSLVIGVATALGQNVSYTWQQVGGSASGSGTFTGSSLNIKDLPEGIILDLSIDPTHFQRFAIGIGSFNPQRLTEIRQWGDVAWTSMASAFVGCSNMLLTATDIPNLTGVTDMSNMFSYCSSFNQALPEGFNTSNVTNMFAMFNGCTIYDQPLPSSFNTANVTDMGHMFRQCSRYNQTLPNSFNTEKVTNMHRMFEECFAYDKALPSSFNTANVTDMSYMFRRCSAYNKALPSGFTTAAVTNMTVMFGSCTVFDQSVSNFNTEKVTSMFLMFSNCAAFNQSVSNFNTEKVTDMSGMFFGCQAFNQSLANFKLNPEVKLTEFLNRSGLSVANYDATLKAFNAQSVTGRTMGATGLQYCEAEADRTNLVKSTVEGGKGWTITDGGIGCAITPSGGTVAGSTTVCSGTNSTLLTLSGNTGNVVGWQSSTTEDFTNPTNIVNTTTSLTATNLTQTTYYRAVVINTGSAGSRVSASVIYSTVATITVSPVSVGGTVSGGTTVVAGVNSTTLTLSGHTGSVVKWQSSTSSEFTNPVDMANTTTSLTVTNLTQTTHYRAVVKSGACPEAFSSVATISLEVISAGNCTEANPQCSGNQFEIAKFTLSVPSSGSRTLTLSYRAVEGNSTGRIRINGGSWQTFTLPQTAINASFVTVSIGSYSLQKGSNSIELASGVGYLCFRQLCAEGSTSSCDFTVLGSPSVLTAAPRANVTLSVGCTGSGCSGLSYQWSGNGASCASANCVLQAPTTAGSYTYTVTASKDGCTPQTATVTLTVQEQAPAGSTLSLGDQCTGNSQEIRSYSLTSTGGTFPFSLTYRSLEGNALGRIRINGGSWQVFSLPQTPANQSFATVAIGSYALINGTNTIEFASGERYFCLRQLSLEGVINTLDCNFSIFGNPSVMSIAPGGILRLNAGCSGTGCSGISYQWSGNGATCAAAECTVQAPTTAGEYTYTVTASKQGCNTTSTATVTVRVVLDVNPGVCLALGDQCSGNSQEIRSYSLSAAAAGSYPLRLSYRSHEGATQGRIRINGGSWQSFVLPQTPTNLSFASVDIGSYALLNGSNSIELATGGLYMCFRELCLDAPSQNPNCGFTVKGNPASLTVAPGSTVTLNSTCSGSGCEGVSYQWSGNGATCAGTSCTVQAPTVAGSYTYTLTASKEGCSSQTTTVTVQVSAAVLPERCVALGDQCSGNSQEIRSYSLSLTAAGSYPLSLTYRSHEGATQGRIRINGGSWQTFNLAQTPGDLSYVTAAIGNYTLNAGANSIELATGERFMCFRQLCAGDNESNVRRGVYESFELPVALAMEVYPNPTSGQLTLRVRTSYSGAGVVEVLDLTGRSVQQQAVTLDAGDNQLNLNVASQPKGMYLLRVRDAAGRQGALRFIRQ